MCECVWSIEHGRVSGKKLSEYRDLFRLFRATCDFCEMSEV